MKCWTLIVMIVSVFSTLGLGVIAQTVQDSNLIVENVITSGSVTRPISMVFLDTQDILICEQHTGRVRRVIQGVVQPGQVLDLPVATANEQGLLNIILHPDFENNGFIYVFYTRAASDGGSSLDQRINRYFWDGESLTDETTVLILPSSPGPNHNGGVLVFGPPDAAPEEQKLFAVIGDLNRQGQLENYASGPAPDDTGSIIRINPDGTTPTGDEAGPFFSVAGGNASLERLYAYGIRNSFGLDFDPVTNVLWQTENGPADYDEINRVPPAFNSGWRYIMGPLSRNSLKGAPGLVDFSGVGTYGDPAFSWLSAVAPTAIHFLRGNGLGASYLHDCFVAAHNNGTIYRFQMNTGRDGFVLHPSLQDLVLDPGDDISANIFGTGFPGPSELRTGPDGNLYVVSLFANQIFRIRSNVTRVMHWQSY